MNGDIFTTASGVAVAMLEVLDKFSGAVTAVATAFIAIFTIVLVLVTRRQARLSRESIDLARSQFIATHRPRIVLKDVSFVDGQLLYMLVNTGDTEATVVESWILDELVRTGQPIRPLRSAGHHDLGRLILAGGEIRDLTHDPKMGAFMRVPDMMRIGVEDQPPMIGEIYFTGAILYSDNAGIRRRSVFRRRWDRGYGSFIRLNDPDQEYAD
jgi:hypothetical protein